MKNKGMALLLALFTLTITSLLVVAFLELTTTDLQITSNHFDKNQALYIADAGVEYAISQLKNNRSWSGTPGPIEFPAGSGNTYSVTYTSTSGKIVSAARLSSGPQVTLQAKVNVRGNTFPYNVKIISWREL